MDEFLEDLKNGEIRFRDRWQFELKSEFSPSATAAENSYRQEFYFFIPNSLHITAQTYSREEFYIDLTNLIRYKTPVIPLKNFLEDPIFQLKALSELPLDQSSIKKWQTELKLMGNVFRSSLRREIQKILAFSLPPEGEVRDLCHEIENFRYAFLKLPETYHLNDSHELKVTYDYLDEFIGTSIDYYLTSLLNQFRMHNSPVSQSVEDNLCRVIIAENDHQEKTHHALIKFSSNTARDEQILYRLSLLKKYFLDALLLEVDRTSVQERFGTFISSFSAGIAMFVYVLLFIWQGQWFVINSLPFIVITVAAYILKDRLKEGLKSLSFRRALSYFSDFSTKILTPQDEVIGELKEFFTFVDESQIPEDIRKIRNFDFHSMLKSFKRPEQVFYFKRIVTTYLPKNKKLDRLKSLTISLRYNLQDYLEKASDPYHSYSTLDKTTRAILKLRLPKVYHLNVILKNRYLDDEGKKIVELQKFRIIIDKNGIKNIEQIKA